MFTDYHNDSIDFHKLSCYNYTTKIQREKYVNKRFKREKKFTY